MIVTVTLTAWLPDDTPLDAEDFLVKIDSRRDPYHDMHILAIQSIEETG
jgi:hypothetical protein